ncbi:MAG TPA: SH3 domain-containing protein [Burkholderiaceae bacterium]|nr:SH3 domain-containing protein [Burkholderiaceae bacterium]
MDMARLYGAGAFLAALVLTLFLASCLTPRQWWRRPNARALLVLVAGTWGFGSLILSLAPVPRALAQAPGQERASAAAAPAPGVPGLRAGLRAGLPATLAGADPASGGQPAPAIAGQPFQVHRALHLRAAAGVAAPLLATVPPGATVSPTGARDGDWWQVRATTPAGSDVGWVSSLWLRRSGE